MTLVATSPSAIRPYMVAAIKAITPQHTAHAAKRWHEVQRADETRGTFRGFFLQFLPGYGVEDEPSIFGTAGAEYLTPLRIWTGYRDLSEIDDQSIITEDHADLYGALQLLKTPAVPGLASCGGDSLAFEFAEDGEQLWGFFTFNVRYLQRYRAGAT